MTGHWTSGRSRRPWLDANEEKSSETYVDQNGLSPSHDKPRSVNENDALRASTFDRLLSVVKVRLEDTLCALSSMSLIPHATWAGREH